MESAAASRQSLCRAVATALNPTSVSG
jgi:hypothetical protein